MARNKRYFRKLRRRLVEELYANEMSHLKLPKKEILNRVLDGLPPSSRLKRHAKRVIGAVVDKRDVIDAELDSVLKATPFGRMGDLEKTIMRVGAAEILFYRHLVPPAAAVNEAVELAKSMVDEDFASLVNATLRELVERVDSGGESPEIEG